MRRHVNNSVSCVDLNSISPPLDLFNLFCSSHTRRPRHRFSAQFPVKSIPAVRVGCRIRRATHSTVWGEYFGKNSPLGGIQHSIKHTHTSFPQKEAPPPRLTPPSPRHHEHPPVPRPRGSRRTRPFFDTTRRLSSPVHLFTAFFRLISNTCTNEVKLT